MYNNDRCYVYNKAMAKYLSNRTNETVEHEYVPMFDMIREWAEERGIYESGDPKTQYVKLMEEAGEVGRAILKNNDDDIMDGIGDMVVVLTNLAELCGTTIEECTERAYAEIVNRQGKMINGTFVKNN